MSNKNILMVASENDALPKAKVGGIGDVIRDIPPALAKQNCNVNVVLPSYGFLHALSGATKISHFPVAFNSELLDVTVYRLAESDLKGESVPGVTQWVIHHAKFSPCGKTVYCNDPSERPFATDATKYALFCAAVGQAIIQNVFGNLDVIHLHDWHSAMLAVLRAYDPHYKKLNKIPTVYTIHNLALQGVRPFVGDASSVQQWFPSLKFDISVICDPEFTHCINPMRAGINLADKVHAVSPTYAEEIQKPSLHSEFIYGGEGLESDLLSAASEGRLVGILNGCEYPTTKATSARLSKNKLAQTVNDALIHWVANEVNMPSCHWLASKRLGQWVVKKERGMLLTSVGRLTSQKVALMQMQCTIKKQTASALEHLLQALDSNCTFVLLGSGDPELELFLQKVSAKHANFIFLRGYSEDLAAALYASGDLFLMPSSFEPCGISQMLAMRAGQPCVVHGVGGLQDTVVDGETGFVFMGENGEKQALNWVKTTINAVAMAKSDSAEFKLMGKRAAQARFEWSTVAQQYIEKLYTI